MGVNGPAARTGHWDGGGWGDESDCYAWSLRSGSQGEGGSVAFPWRAGRDGHGAGDGYGLDCAMLRVGREDSRSGELEIQYYEQRVYELEGLLGPDCLVSWYGGWRG